MIWLGILAYAFIGVFAAWLDITGRLRTPVLFFVLGCASTVPLLILLAFR